MHSEIEKINQVIAPLRQQILNHKVYGAIQSMEDLQIFMQYHVYAVWDFMSLLKTLQNNLTCTQVPWHPKGNAAVRYLINEIVVGEESDMDEHNRRISHFELYLNAMTQIGASTAQINHFLDHLLKNGSLSDAFKAAQVPLAAQKFVQFTFDIINSNKPHLQAAIFTFGREDLIPGMFMSIIQDLHALYPHSIGTFKYYLERHIEVDGGHHSHLALEMTQQLCEPQAQYWEEALDATIASLQMRQLLWDGVYDEIMSHRA